MQNSIRIEGIVTNNIQNGTSKTGTGWLKFGIFWGEQRGVYECSGFFNCFIIGDKKLELLANYIKPKSRIVLSGVIKPNKNKEGKQICHTIWVNDIVYSGKQNNDKPSEAMENIKEGMKRFESVNKLKEGVKEVETDEITIEI